MEKINTDYKRRTLGYTFQDAQPMHGLAYRLSYEKGSRED